MYTQPSKLTVFLTSSSNSRYQVSGEKHSYRISKITQTFTDPEVEQLFQTNRHLFARQVACWLILVVASTLSIILLSDQQIIQPQFWPVLAVTWRVSFVLVSLLFAGLALRAKTPKQLHRLNTIFTALMTANLVAMDFIYATNYVLFALFDVIIILSLYFATTLVFSAALFFGLTYAIVCIALIYTFKEVTPHTKAMLVASYFAANVGGIIVSIQQNQLQRRYFAREQQLLALTETLSKQAYVDSLTNLKNRHAFDIDYPSIQKLIRRNHANNLHSYVVIADIDKFKSVNDTYGHDVGDQVLQDFAKFLERNIRPTDFIYRFGGEEFVIILQSCILSDVEKRLHAVIEQLNDHIIAPALIPYPVTASFGVTKLILNEVAKNAIARADIALYVSKNSGRNTYSYQPPASDV